MASDKNKAPDRSASARQTLSFSALVSQMSRRRAIGLVVAGVTVAVFLLSIVRFFNILAFEDRVQNMSLNYMRNYADTKRFSDSLVRIVVIPKEPNDGPAPSGNIQTKHRVFFGQLVKAMAEAGARSVTFDIEFLDNPVEDLALGVEIVNASAKGMPTISGVTSYSSLNGLYPPIPNALQKVKWGLTEAGGRKGEYGPITMMKLAERNPAGTGGNDPIIVPTLPLRALMESHKLEADLDETLGRLHLYTTAPTRELFRSIPLEYTNAMLLDNASDDEIRDARIDPAVLMGEFNNPDALKKYKDAIVFVGYEHGEAHSLLTGGSGLGVELHATAVSNIINGAFIYKLPTLVNLLIILFMGILGALLHTRIGQMSELTIPITIPIINLPVPIPIGLMTVAVVYVVVAYLVFMNTRVYLDVCYHLAALTFSYGCLWFVLGRWFGPPPKQPAGFVRQRR